MNGEKPLKRADCESDDEYYNNKDYYWLKKPFSTMCLSCGKVFGPKNGTLTTFPGKPCKECMEKRKREEVIKVGKQILKDNKHVFQRLSEI